MLCQKCNQREANVHITKIINGVKTEMHFCEECARESQEVNMSIPLTFGMPMSFQNILEGFMEMMGGIPQQLIEEISCPVCHITFESFKQTGRLGCGNCYSAFSDNIIPLIKRIHGSIQHTGKVPKRSGGILKIKRDIDKLKNELKIAVANEEYEKAAKLRDEIKRLEERLNNKQDKE